MASNLHPNPSAPTNPASTDTDPYSLTNAEQWDLNALTHHTIAHTVQRQLQQENHISTVTIHKQLIETHHLLPRLKPLITNSQDVL